MAYLFHENELPKLVSTVPGRERVFFVSKELRPHLDFKKCFVYSKRTFFLASDHRPIVMRIMPEPAK